MIESNITICPLSKVGVQHWFEVEPRPKDVQAALEKLNTAIDEGIVDPDLRLVALKDGIVIARFAARVDSGGRFYFWPPTYSSNLPSNSRSEVAQSFLSYCENLRATHQVKFLETKPADDLPQLDEWLAILTANGFQEVSCAHVYDYYLSEQPPLAHADKSRVTLVPANSLPDEVIGRLIYECDEETLDRVDEQYHEDSSAHWNEIKRSRSIPWSPALSHVALLDEQPAGLILSGREPVTGDGWILYVGVVRRFRRQHVATQVLDSALHSFYQYGIKRVRALIDEMNLPSISLHAAVGFQRQPGRFMTHRKILS